MCRSCATEKNVALGRFSSLDILVCKEGSTDLCLSLMWVVETSAKILVQGQVNGQGHLLLLWAENKWGVWFLFSGLWRNGTSWHGAFRVASSWERKSGPSWLSSPTLMMCLQNIYWAPTGTSHSSKHHACSDSGIHHTSIPVLRLGDWGTREIRVSHATLCGQLPHCKSPEGCNPVATQSQADFFWGREM